MLKKFGFITVSGLGINPNMAIYGHIWSGFSGRFQKPLKPLNSR
jgi:hypothetical protein